MSSFSPSPLRSRTGTMAPLDPIIIFGWAAALAGIEPWSFDLGLFVMALLLLLRRKGAI